MKFKVGDRVRVKDYDSDRSMEGLVGRIVVVCRSDSYPYFIRTDDIVPKSNRHSLRSYEGFDIPPEDAEHYPHWLFRDENLESVEQVKEAKAGKARETSGKAFEDVVGIFLKK